MATLENSRAQSEPILPTIGSHKARDENEPSKIVEEPTEAELREAKHFWGDLFTPDKKCSPTLNGLLLAIAKYISRHFDSVDHNDLTPAQLAAFYKAVGGNYDLLFIDTPVNAIAFIYQQLGCLHSLQPTANSDGFTIPDIPALKPHGFVVWQTKQLLLGPEEHVGFIQRALEKFDLVDPETNRPYPKLLPSDCFPSQPDPDTVRWYENVSQKLRADHEQESMTVSTGPTTAYKRRSTPTVDAVEYSADEGRNAPRHPDNGSYRGYSQRSFQSSRPARPNVPRPVQVVHDTRRSAASPRMYPKQSSLDPPASRMRRRSWHAQSEPDDDSEGIDHLELATTRRPLARRQSRDRARSTSRGSLSSSEDDNKDRRQTQSHHSRRRSLQSRDSGSHGSSRPVSLRRDSAKAASRIGSQSLRQSRAASPEYRPRRRMSHDSPASPEDYFPPYPTGARRPNIPYHSKHNSHTSQLSSSPTSANPVGPNRHKGFSPSTDASFAAHVAHLQGSGYSANEGDSGDIRGPYMVDEHDQMTRDRPRIQVRDENGRRYSRDEDYEARYPPSPRSARRYPNDDADYHQRSGMRSRSSEGRYARDRRQHERNRAAAADRDYDRDEDRSPRDDRDPRRQQTRRARFAGPGGGNTVGVDGRSYPDWS